MNKAEATYYAHQSAEKLAIEASRDADSSASVYNAKYKEVFQAVYRTIYDELDEKETRSHDND